MLVTASSQSQILLGDSVNLQWIIFRFPSVQTQLAISTAHEVFALLSWREVPASFHHLLGFANPGSFRFVRPTNGKGSSPGIGNPWTRRISHLVGVVFLGLC